MSGNNAHDVATMAAAQRAANTKMAMQNRQILDIEKAKRHKAQHENNFNNKHIMATVVPYIDKPMGEAIKQNVIVSMNNFTTSESNSTTSVKPRKYII